MFKDRKTREIKIKKEDNDYIYFYSPKRLRVNKSTFAFEKIDKKGNWKPCHYTWAGMKQSPYPAISVNYKCWSVPRMLAVAFVDNPNHYKFVSYDDPFKPSGIRWVPSLASRELRNDVTSIEARKDLQGLDTNSNEYYRRYNKITGLDGLTNAKRYVQRRKELGLVNIPAHRSPIGRSIWVTVALREKINKAHEINEELGQDIIQQIIECDNLARCNNVYKRYNKTGDNHGKTEETDQRSSPV